MQKSSFTISRVKGQLNYCLLLLLTATCCPLVSLAQGDLLLYPRRIVFEGSKKSHSLNVANTGKDSVRYFISVVQMRMKDDGSFETITHPDSAQNFADKNFRFFPRNVVLGPNESQTVKMQLVNTGGLTPGEYRSHLYFRAEPEKRPLGERDVNKDSSAISVKLVAVFGISIPVIIRIGETTSEVNISHVSLKQRKDTIPVLSLAFQRTGNISVYGDITVDHISTTGKSTRVGIVKGMAIYTPNLVRYFNLPLDTTSGADFSSGKLKIAYKTPVETKSQIISETEFVLL